VINCVLTSSSVLQISARKFYSDLCWQIVSYELTAIAIFYSFKTWCFPPTWVGSASLGIDLNYAKSKVHCKRSPNNISSCSWATWSNSFDRWELRASISQQLHDNIQGFSTHQIFRVPCTLGWVGFISKDLNQMMETKPTPLTLWMSRDGNSSYVHSKWNQSQASFLGFPKQRQQKWDSMACIDSASGFVSVAVCMWSLQFCQISICAVLCVCLCNPWPLMIHNFLWIMCCKFCFVCWLGA
jgi:hypothetical protein